jgi:hypothetical protein
MQICENLKLDCLPIPKELGKDRLATFTLTGSLNNING